MKHSVDRVAKYQNLTRGIRWGGKPFVGGFGEHFLVFVTSGHTPIRCNEVVFVHIGQWDLRIGEFSEEHGFVRVLTNQQPKLFRVLSPNYDRVVVSALPVEVKSQIERIYRKVKLKWFIKTDLSKTSLDG